MILPLKLTPELRVLLGSKDVWELQGFGFGDNEGFRVWGCLCRD